VADALVREGVPFRAAHHVVGSIVMRAEEAGVALGELADPAWSEALAASADSRARELALDANLAERLRRAATVAAALASCDVIGGTAPGRVHAELEAAASRLGVRLPPDGESGETA
jgi:argininosuccinate lyase